MNKEEKQARILNGVHRKIKMIEQNAFPKREQEKHRRSIKPFIAASLCLLLVIGFIASNTLFPHGSVSAPSSKALSFYAGAQPETLKLSNLDQRFIAGNNHLGMSMLSSLYKEKNIVVSPVSLVLPLLMINEGAKGETAEQILSVLGLVNLSEEEKNAAIAQLLNRISSDGMEFSNSLWVSQGLDMNPDYLDTCVNRYSSDVGLVDFSDKTSLEEIDRYIKEKNTWGIRWDLFPRRSGYRTFIDEHAVL